MPVFEYGDAVVARGGLAERVAEGSGVAVAGLHAFFYPEELIRKKMEALSHDEFDIVAAHLTPASLAACMMVSKTVRAFTKTHYEPSFIADYELQQSKWSRTAFIRDVKTAMADLVSPIAYPDGVRISAEALRLLHLACEHYVYDARAGNLHQPRLCGYMTVDNDGTPDPDYHPSDDANDSLGCSPMYVK